ncbi:hypothetical protein L2D14_03295 [Thalassospiraceae bacterium LMO-JJ14]|nr:hypothetical protein L2D14_03295 [Thalassospiraceae bacterium LMO-JJ14]
MQDLGIDVLKHKAAEVVQKPLQLILQARLVAVRVLPVFLIGIPDKGVIERRIGDRAEMLLHETFLLPFCRHRFG